MLLQINITKEVLFASRDCDSSGLIGQNCAIGKAIVDVFGLKSWVGQYSIELYNNIISSIPRNNDCNIIGNIQLPLEATLFIRKFDKSCPLQREVLTPFSFEIDVPDEILEQIIDISEIDNLLNNAKYITYDKQFV